MNEIWDELRNLLKALPKDDQRRAHRLLAKYVYLKEEEAREEGYQDCKNDVMELGL